MTTPENENSSRKAARAVRKQEARQAARQRAARITPYLPLALRVAWEIIHALISQQPPW